MRLEVDLGHWENRSTREAGPGFTDRYRQRFLTPNRQIGDPGVDPQFVARLELAKGAPIEDAVLQAILAVEAAGLASMHYLDRVNFAAVFPGKTKRRAILVWETPSARVTSQAAAIGVQGVAELLPGARAARPAAALKITCSACSRGVRSAR